MPIRVDIITVNPSPDRTLLFDPHLPPALSDRLGIAIYNPGPTIVRWGGDTVTTAITPSANGDRGMPIMPGGLVEIDCGPSDIVYAMTDSLPQDVYVVRLRAN